MGRYATDSGGGTFTPAPTGTHIARCYRIIDLGTQHGEYMGEPTRRSQILVSWELPDELISVGDNMVPVTASKFYTNTLGEKGNLRKDLANWRGRDFSTEELEKFDLENILGKPCLLTIVAKDNGKTKVASVSGLPKNTQCPPQVNPSSTFWLDEYDEAKFEALPKGIKAIIEKSEEYPQAVSGEVYQPPPPAQAFDDDIPF